MPNGASVQLWLWDSTNSVWVKAACDADGKLKIDPTEILEDTPTDNEVGKAPTSNWAHDHAANASAHHTKYTDAEAQAIADTQIATHAALPTVHQDAPALIATHTANPDAHHAKYTDAEAIAAAKTDGTLLNYTEGARVYHDASQVIAPNTATDLAFNSERYDTDGIHDPATNNSRLTCQTAGKYIIVANIMWEAFTSSGFIFLRIMLNGSITIGYVGTLGSLSFACKQVCVTIYDLAVGNYIEVRVEHSSTVDQAVLTSAQSSPEFMMQRIG